jgi:diguanylate cyclase (GGDEF)-like protein
MTPAPTLEDDENRVTSLEKMNLLDTAREAEFDRIVRVTQRYFKADIVLISLVDKDRQWVKARCGLNTQETSREISFCGHAIEYDEIFVVENAKKDKRFFDNPLVAGAPFIEFYAGQPLKNAEGFRTGTLCLLSSKSRRLSRDEKYMLEDLGRITEQLLENRQLGEAQNDLLESLGSTERGKLIDTLSGLWNRHGFAALLPREIHRAAGNKEAFAVGIVEIDRFDELADRYGEKTRDDAVKLTAEILFGSSRAGDIVTRLADGNFQFIAADVNSKLIVGLGNKILKLFRSRAKLSTDEGTIKFTVSIGMAVSLTAGNAAILRESASKTAQDALARAKHAGGDHCEIERTLLTASAA